MDIIRFKDTKITKWSGGETFEILIYPLHSQFNSADYNLRISVATVNLEQTTFTSLPGVNRILTVLEGSLTLVHEGHHSSKLAPYEQDRFQGDWKTNSTGIVRDFNVMWKIGEASVEHLSLAKGQSQSIRIDKRFCVIFLANGQVRFDDKEIEKNDAIYFEDEVTIQANIHSELIIVTYQN